MRLCNKSPIYAIIFYIVEITDTHLIQRFRFDRAPTNKT